MFIAAARRPSTTSRHSVTFVALSLPSVATRGSDSGPHPLRRDGERAWCTARRSRARDRLQTSSAIASIASTKASRLDRGSVSVGSIMSASSTSKREVDRGRMEAVVEQPLGDVEGPHPMLALLTSSGEHELMHASAVVGQVVSGPETLLQIVRGKHRLLGDLAQSVCADSTDVRVSTHEHREVAVEAPDPADGSPRATRSRTPPSLTRTGSGPGRKRARGSGDADGARSRTSAPVRRA